MKRADWAVFWIGLAFGFSGGIVVGAVIFAHVWMAS